MINRKLHPAQQKLLPCPFCGSPARDDLLPHAGGPGWVECSSCECDQHMSDTMEEAVARWNTRAAAPPQRALPKAPGDILELYKGSYLTDAEAIDALEAAFIPSSLQGQINMVYGALDTEDCRLVDREWAKMRGYILPSDGTSTLIPAAGSLLPSQIAQRESAKKWRDNHPAPAEPTREALLDRVIRDSIEALERNSTSAPVVECLKAALAHSAPAAGTKSAPVVPASHNSGERDPSVMPDYAGADTAPTAHPAPAATRSMWQRPEYDPELSLLGAVSEMATSPSPAGTAAPLSDTRLASALHEASVYGIGATSDTNQKVILEAAKTFAAWQAYGERVAKENEALRALVEESRTKTTNEINISNPDLSELPPQEKASGGA